MLYQKKYISSDVAYEIGILRNIFTYVMLYGLRWCRLVSTVLAFG